MNHSFENTTINLLLHVGDEPTVGVYTLMQYMSDSASGVIIVSGALAARYKRPSF